MVQSDTINVDVAFLTYNPTICSDTPSVRHDAPVDVDLNDMIELRERKRIEKRDMGREAYRHYKWYISMLIHELKASSDNEEKSKKMRIFHWHIESGNTDAFKMNGTLYKAVSLVLGEDMEHWYCANNSKGEQEGNYSYGSRYRSDRENQKVKNSNEKIACFTINDNEGIFYVKETPNNIVKCTPEICANNCMDCKKLKSPFTKTNKISGCACFPSSNEFQKITESDFEDSENEDQDIATLPSKYSLIKNLKKFTLNSIKEESIIE